MSVEDLMTCTRNVSLSVISSPQSKEDEDAKKEILTGIISTQREIVDFTDVFRGKNVLSYFNKGTAEEKRANMKEVHKFISFIILSFASTVNTSDGKNLNSYQIFEIADILLEESKYMRLEDIVFCFKRAKQGKYGKFYNRMDVPTVLGIWEQYKLEYEENFELEKRRELAKYKERPINHEMFSSSMRETIRWKEEDRREREKEVAKYKSKGDATA
jgi:hypothetical protein